MLAEEGIVHHPFRAVLSQSKTGVKIGHFKSARISKNTQFSGCEKVVDSDCGICVRVIWGRVTKEGKEHCSWECIDIVMRLLYLHSFWPRSLIG